MSDEIIECCIAVGATVEVSGWCAKDLNRLPCWDELVLLELE